MNKKIATNKNFKISIIVGILTSLFIAFIVCFNIFTKADSPSSDIITKSNEYASVTRDTSIELDTAGILNIKRTQKESIPMGTENAWTIFIYMTGSDLESDYESATKDIKEMFAANYGEQHFDKLNVIIQTGGSPLWHTSGIESDKIQRFRLEGDKLNLVESFPLYNMGQASTLYSFLNWGIKNYPAEHMGLIFWNHGSGVSQGLCVDPLYNFDSLSLGEVEYALAKVSKKMTDKFELIGFDTCLSGSIEYANILATYGKYMVASADSEPGDGWHYTPIIDYLSQNPDATGEEIGKVIANAYTDYYSSEENIANYTTMAVYDLSKVDSVCIEINNFAKYLAEKLNSDTNTLSKLASTMRDCHVYDSLNLDLGTLIASLKTGLYFDYNTQALETALFDFILYKNIGESFASLECNGLSIYLPSSIPTLAELNMYRNAGFSPYWLDILEYIMARTKNSTLSDYCPNNWSTSPYFFEDNFNFITYDNTQLSSSDAAKLINSNPDYAANDFVDNWLNVLNVQRVQFNSHSLPQFGPVNLNIERNNNNISAKISNTDTIYNVYSTIFKKINSNLVCLGENADVTYNESTGKITSNFTGEWFTLPDGQLLTAYVVSKSKNSVIYGIPVVIKDTEVTIRIKETKLSNDEKSYDLLGIWDATQYSAYSPRAYLPLEKGTTITPIYDIYNLESDTYDTEYGYEYTIKSDFDFLFSKISDGKYSYAYTIDPVFGNDTFTKLSDFTVSKGEITYSENKQ